jgi:hypothetical protein
MQLPLWAYLLVSAAAIAALALLVRRLNPGSAPSLTAQDALHRFRDDFPRVESASAAVTPDGRTFLVLAPSGAIVGCVTLVGLRWTTRRIGARDVARASADGPRTLVTFHDFTWPSLKIDWRDPAAARDWRDRFDAMRRPDHA